MVFYKITFKKYYAQNLYENFNVLKIIDTYDSFSH